MAGVSRLSPDMRVTPKSGIEAEINREGSLLLLYGADGSELCVISPPEHAGFYQFAHHAIEGECPIVSFDPAFAINGWSDWYYKIDVQRKKIERLNPWR